MACGAISSRPRLAGRFGASQQQHRDALCPSRALRTIPSIEPSCRLRRESTSLHSTVSKCFHFLPRIGTFQCLAGDGSEKNHSRARSVVAFKNLASPRAARGGGRVRLDRIWGLHSRTDLERISRLSRNCSSRQAPWRSDMARLSGLFNALRASPAGRTPAARRSAPRSP